MHLSLYAVQCERRTLYATCTVCYSELFIEGYCHFYLRSFSFFRLSRSLCVFFYLCGNDIMLQCFSFPLLLLSGLFVVNAVLLSFPCLHKIKVGENKL